jgi:7-carboxy-7-deazaguanine synthase
MMLTGGSPTMQPDLCNELTHFANERGIFITIETEGSHFIETDYPFGLISLSPKFSNSVPKIDVTTPMGKLVDQKMIDQHNKLRLNHQAIELAEWQQQLQDPCLIYDLLFQAFHSCHQDFALVLRFP